MAFSRQSVRKCNAHPASVRLLPSLHVKIFNLLSELLPKLPLPEVNVCKLF